jgi:hypothetical protein
MRSSEAAAVVNRAFLCVGQFLLYRRNLLLLLFEDLRQACNNSGGAETLAVGGCYRARNLLCHKAQIALPSIVGKQFSAVKKGSITPLPPYVTSSLNKLKMTT